MSIFKLVAPTEAPVPILLSVPHCGTDFPPEVASHFKKEMSAAPDDTDWFVHKLYDFAPAMGISMIYANISRWVIDLNRDPQSKPLYNDGRIITALCPATDFKGESIYVDGREQVDGREVKRRLEAYYEPYHKQIEKKLLQLKQRFGKVLLWECHSIRQMVTTIYPEKFPDLILGDADGKSAGKVLSETALKELRKSKLNLSHNHPFKGGYITRHFGHPELNQHALQLEMTKVNYMDDAEKKYEPRRAEKIRTVLQRTFESLIKKMN